MEHVLCLGCSVLRACVPFPCPVWQSNKVPPVVPTGLNSCVVHVQESNDLAKGGSVPADDVPNADNLPHVTALQKPPQPPPAASHPDSSGSTMAAANPSNVSPVSSKSSNPASQRFQDTADNSLAAHNIATQSSRAPDHSSAGVEPL